MVPILSLWLPIVLSSVIVFLASSIMHMVLKYHQSDYSPLPKEAEAMSFLRGLGLAPAYYHFPRPASMKDMGSPEMLEKFKQGPVGFLAILPSGAPKMGKFLSQWFVYCLVVAFFAAYLAGRTVQAGAPYLAVFRVVGTVAFMAHGLGRVVDSIWMGSPWKTTFKHVFDGLVFSLLTAGTFGWLWPR